MAAREPDDETPTTRPPPSELPRVSTWLVDGYNALHAVVLGGEPREAWWRDDARRRLIDRIAGFEGDDATVWIVFDGRRPAGLDASAGTPSRIRIEFAPSADDWIVARTRRAEIPADLGVVTADRRVAGRCRHAGAVVVSPREFLAHCRAAGEDDTTLP